METTITTAGALEAHSLWYYYKSMVWADENSIQSQTVHTIMRTLRSIHNRGKLAYVSVPITSGKYYYESKFKQPQAEDKLLMVDVIANNYALGLTLVANIEKNRQCPVLYPADLVPLGQKWEQAHFQALWLTLIAEMATELHMSENWEFSNGGAEEFTHVMQLRLGLPRHDKLLFFNSKQTEEENRKRMKSIEVFDHLGNPISLDKGLQKIKQATKWITSHGFKSERLEHCSKLLEWTKERTNEGFYQ